MAPNPLYMLQMGMDSSQPTGIPSYLYGAKSKALSLWNWPNEAFIPVSSVTRSKVDLILHWPFGAPNSISRIDSHRITDTSWNDSVSNLILKATSAGANVTVYTGSVQDTPDPQQALEALDFLAQQATIHRCNIIIDAAAVNAPTSKTIYRNGAEAYIAALDSFANKLHKAGLKFGVEGMWSPALYEAIGKKTDIHFVEFGTVANSYANPDSPAWKTIVKPDPSKVCVWLAGAEWEKARAGQSYTDLIPQFYDGLSCLNLGAFSAIGAHDWYFTGFAGAPRVIVSGGNKDCRSALKIPVLAADIIQN